MYTLHALHIFEYSAKWPILGNTTVSNRTCLQHVATTSDEYEEKFLSLTKQHTLSNAEIKKIKEHYVTNYNIKANQLQVSIFI
ncbi:2258_t:CDS:2 [Cetraspora pellucida]|uniref:2258_t:CDS:1 n=1 Tax=Cetraspora pellucida TaxID=1433469 RepID=A0ACA9KRV9_9GLOM|nr:2258_t:CDS:2 [Cetraspora pellucida]